MPTPVEGRDHCHLQREAVVWVRGMGSPRAWAYLHNSRPTTARRHSRLLDGCLRQIGAPVLLAFTTIRKQFPPDKLDPQRHLPARWSAPAELTPSCPCSLSALPEKCHSHPCGRPIRRPSRLRRAGQEPCGTSPQSCELESRSRMEGRFLSFPPGTGSPLP